MSHSMSLVQKGQLGRFLSALTGEATVPMDSNLSPPWFEPGVNSEISEETYFHLLELLPPRWMNRSVFAFGEGNGPFRLFWQRSGRFFGRELTAAETGRFCELTGTALQQ